jgi:hypothetical protein
MAKREAIGIARETSRRKKQNEEGHRWRNYGLRGLESALHLRRLAVHLATRVRLVAENAGS